MRLWVVVALVMAVAGLWSVSRSVGSPALQVRFDPSLIVSSLKPAGWDNDQKPFDRIVEVDGAPVATPDDVRALVSAKAVPGSFALAVMREGKRVTYPVSSYQVTWRTLLQHNADLFLFSFLLLGLGTWVAWRSTTNQEAKAFLFLATTLGLTGILTADFDISHVWWPVYLVSYCLTGSALLLMGYAFLRRDRLPRWPMWMGGLLSLAIVATYPAWEWVRAVPSLVELNFALLYQASVIWTGGIGFAGLMVLMLAAYLKSKPSSLFHRQLRLILSGTVIAVMPLIYTFVFVLIQGQRPDPIWVEVSLFALGLLPVTMAVAILRYRLFDMEVIFRKTLAYGLAVGVVGSLYFGGLAVATLSMTHAFLKTGSQFALALLAALLLHPVKDRVQNLIDRLFYRDRLDLSKMLQRFEQYSRIDQDQLYNKIAADIQEALRLEKAGIARPQGSDWQVSHCAGREEFLGHVLPVVLPAETSFHLEPQEALGFEAGVRIQLGDQTVALLLLGPKQSEGRFTVADFHYVQLLLAPLSGLIGYSQAKARQKQTEFEIARLYEQVQELNNLKDSFGMVTSHELRTPLTVIIGHAEILLDGMFGELDPAQRDSVSSIHRHAQKLTQNINDYLDLMQLRQSKILLNPKPVDVLTALQEVLPDHLAAADEKKIRLHQTVSQLPYVKADPKRLRQVLHHLLDNAIKFTGPAGTITIEGRTLGNQAFITFRDTGCGIPEDKLPTIFDRFTQGFDPLIRPHGGLGIGLALVKAAIEAMGGDVTLQSQVGTGTAITLQLPLADSPRPGDRDREMPFFRPDGGNPSDRIP